MLRGNISLLVTDTCSGKIHKEKIKGSAVRIYKFDEETNKNKLVFITDSLGNFEFEFESDTSFRANNKIRILKNSLDTTIYIKENENYLSIECPYKLPIVPKPKEVNENEVSIRVAKPAIYLYPSQEQKITVQLDFKGQLGTTYPKYNQGWNVLAKPNGEILNIADNRKYTYLFWEGETKFAESHFNYQSGFVVAKEELDKFLLEKLTYIGLNNTEINDFIVYWLPQMEKNEYNLVHFFINDNIDNSAFLNVNPKPESEIRIFMEFKGVDKSHKIVEQKLHKIERKGFTLVEWGGGISGENKIE